MFEEADDLLVVVSLSCGILQSIPAIEQSLQQKISTYRAAERFQVGQAFSEDTK